jgi:hypothetical protein
MIERILTNWKSTVIGLGILVFGMALLWTGKADVLESLPFLTGLYGLFYRKQREEIQTTETKRDEEINDIRSANREELDSRLSKFRKRQRKN